MVGCKTFNSVMQQSLNVLYCCLMILSMIKFFCVKVSCSWQRSLVVVFWVPKLTNRKTTCPLTMMSECWNRMSKNFGSFNVIQCYFPFLTISGFSRSSKTFSSPATTKLWWQEQATLTKHKYSTILCKRNFAHVYYKCWHIN